MVDPRGAEIAKLEALFSANPEGRVFTHLAEAYRRAGDPERARVLLEAGLARHGDYASAHVVHGRVLLDLGLEREAEAAFRRVLGLDPENLVALRALGDLARRAGRLEEALGHYEQLRAREPSSAELDAIIRDLEEAVGREAASGDAASPDAAAGGVREKEPAPATVEGEAAGEAASASAAVGQEEGARGAAGPRDEERPAPEAEGGAAPAGAATAREAPAGEAAAGAESTRVVAAAEAAVGEEAGRPGDEPGEAAAEGAPAGATEAPPAGDAGVAEPAAASAAAALRGGPAPAPTRADEEAEPEPTQAGAAGPEGAAASVRAAGAAGREGAVAGVGAAVDAVEEEAVPAVAPQGAATADARSPAGAADGDVGSPAGAAVGDAPSAAGEAAGARTAGSPAAEVREAAPEAVQAAARKEAAPAGGQAAEPAPRPEDAAEDEEGLDIDLGTLTDLPPGSHTLVFEDDYADPESAAIPLEAWTPLTEEETGGPEPEPARESGPGEAGEEDRRAGGEREHAPAAEGSGAGVGVHEGAEGEPWEAAEQDRPSGEPVARGADEGWAAGTWVAEADEAAGEAADAWETAAGAEDAGTGPADRAARGWGEERAIPGEVGGTSVSGSVGGGAGEEGEPAGGEVVTETLAEIYLAQGLVDRAVELYRQLVAMRPGEAHLEMRLREAEARLEGAAPGDEPGSEMVVDRGAGSPGAEEPVVEDVEAVWTGVAGAHAAAPSPYTWPEEAEREVRGGGDEPTLGEYLARLLAWRPGQPGEPGAEGAEVTAREVQADGAPPPAEPPAADAEPDDDDLEMFRAWLQSLKR